MRIFGAVILSAALIGCTPHPVLDGMGYGIDYTKAVDVTPGGMVFASYVQTPGMADPYQNLVWRCFGGGFNGGWQGNGCWPAINTDDHGEFMGVRQQLPPDGIFRMSCAKPTATAAVNDPGWCQHAVGIDDPEENEWIVPIDEIDEATGEWVTKHNICVGMMGGVASPAKAECVSLHVEP